MIDTRKYEWNKKCNARIELLMALKRSQSTRYPPKGKRSGK